MLHSLISHQHTLNGVPSAFSIYLDNGLIRGQCPLHRHSNKRAVSSSGDDTKGGEANRGRLRFRVGSSKHHVAIQILLTSTYSQFRAPNCSAHFCQQRRRRGTRCRIRLAPGLNLGHRSQPGAGEEDSRAFATDCGCKTDGDRRECRQ